MDSRKRGFRMSLGETIHQLDHLLCCACRDLEKVQRGNKAAAQRVRVGTIKLEKVAKRFRRESVSAEKSGKFKRKKAKKRRR